ncbi:hemolysin family protein [Clostridium aciditolerans]|uniref:HlyC/CorC family transporter n=1 Tax=Clostridium aciditolerans TaxID=339861 RepID=A0A934HTE6_9CLOT|nr:hemolysin family protein [Clostridium aciditolerans]MBI6871549.1 HlyC/CorC family transporter [Clostridium aciditolerans]
MDNGPSSILLELLLILVLVLINAFFAASEMAIVSLNKNKVNHLAEEGNVKAKYLLKLLNEPSKFLATIQVGITLAGFLASASAATNISKHLSNVLNKFSIPGSNEISVVVITVLLSYVTLVFGELFPKRIALQKSEQIAMFAIKPILFVSKITSPFVKMLTASTNILVKIFGMNLDNLEEKVSEEEIRSMIKVGEENGVINEIEKDMIDSIFKFDDTLAKEIMTPRINVFALELGTPIDELLNQISEEQYSRIPIYENDIDNIIGVLYMKDLFIQLKNKDIENINIKTLLRQPHFVPETKNIDALFRELQSTNNHMAILIDEYGGFSGIVTIEDLIEEIMGNIFDEYDENTDYIKKIDSNTYLINGLIPIDEVNESLNINLPSDDIDTIGGFVVTLLGTIPKDDDDSTIEYDNLKFKIEKVNEKRIEELKVYIG